MQAPPEDAFPKARSVAARALEIDTGLAQAYTARAYTAFYYDFDWEGAGRWYRQALELDASSAAARQFFGAFLMAMGRSNEAFAQLKAAEDLDPLALPVKVAKGWCLCLARRYDEAVVELLAALDMDPHLSTTHQVIGWAYALSGRGAKAVEHHMQFGGTPGSPMILRSSLAHSLVIAGRPDAALEIIREIEASRASMYVSGVQMASVFAALGDRERALEWLADAVRTRDRSLPMLKCDARLDPLRGDPRFHDIEAALKLPA